MSASTNLPSSVSPRSAVRKVLPPSACAAVFDTQLIWIPFDRSGLPSPPQILFHQFLREGCPLLRPLLNAKPMAAQLKVVAMVPLLDARVQLIQLGVAPMLVNPPLQAGPG